MGRHGWPDPHDAGVRDGPAPGAPWPDQHLRGGRDGRRLPADADLTDSPRGKPRKLEDDEILLTSDPPAPFQPFLLCLRPAAHRSRAAHSPTETSRRMAS